MEERGMRRESGALGKRSKSEGDMAPMEEEGSSARVGPRYPRSMLGKRRQRESKDDAQCPRSRGCGLVLVFSAHLVCLVSLVEGW
jgi:hypothetical protein